MRPSSVLDAYSLVEEVGVRRADAIEWFLGSGQKLLPTLIHAVERAGRSGRTITLGEADGPVAAMWGAGPSNTMRDIGFAWFIAARGIEDYVHTMHRFFKAGLDALHRDYPILHAWAYERNDLHHEWMVRMGFHRTSTELELHLGGRFRLFIHQQGD